MASLSRSGIREFLPPISGRFLSRDTVLVGGHSLMVFLFEHESGHTIFLVLAEGVTYEKLGKSVMAKSIHTLISNHGLRIEKVRVIVVHRRVGGNFLNAATSYHKVLFDYDSQQETITSLDTRYLCKKDISKITSNDNFSMKNAEDPNGRSHETSP